MNVLNRRKMVQVNGTLLLLLIASIIGCSLLIPSGSIGPVRSATFFLRIPTLKF